MSPASAGATLDAWIEDIKRSRGTVQRQLIVDLMTAIDQGEFDGEVCGVRGLRDRRRETRGPGVAQGGGEPS